MKVLIAPDSFKESLTAVGAAEAMAQGARQSNESVVVDQCPIGDGGEGTVAALVAATDGETRTSLVHGPLGEKVEAKWGLIDAGGLAQHV